MPARRTKKAKAAPSKPVIEDNGEWKLVPKHKTPFLAVPPEIHLKIMSYLNPIDAVCLSLAK
jgi:hypothetical protein